MRKLAGFLSLFLAALPAAAENSVEDWSWIPDRYEHYGIWDSVCDHRDADGKRLDRCYVTYVDVFAPRPQFAAAFVFVTPASGGLRYEFRFERGTVFSGDALTLLRDGKEIWSLPSCPDLKCVLEGAAAEALAQAMAVGGELRLDMADRYGRNWDLHWSADGFAAALEDMRAAAAQRGL
jgi:hypothetical protein